jgi:transaldolase
MKPAESNSNLVRRTYDFLTEDFHPRFGRPSSYQPDNPLWQRLRTLGAELWLDTGHIPDIEQLWTRQFTALTTNNTLLNREVQTGIYDSLITRAAAMLEEAADLSEEQRTLELAFILNAWHGLRLVENFDSYVSVEEHTALASDVEAAVEYARRFYAICPERFTVKMPFTPAGLLATRKAAAEGIRINHTLGFSARQNYVIARISRPAFVNVFLGRLNSFIADNNLGSGEYIGEKATLASQRAVTQARIDYHTPSRQIGASFRDGRQVRDLAGIDVMTMPPKVAREFLDMGLSIEQVEDRASHDYTPGVDPKLDLETIRLETLWRIDEELVNCVDKLEQENLDAFTPDDLVNFFADHGCGDFMVKWTDSQMHTSAEEGKIPKLENWKDALEQKEIGLDSLMNLAGLNSFATDQRAMDGRVKEVLQKHHIPTGA